MTLLRYLLWRGLLHEVPWARCRAWMLTGSTWAKMVRLAAKRGDATYFVANMKDNSRGRWRLRYGDRAFAPLTSASLPACWRPRAHSIPWCRAPVISLGLRKCSTIRRTLTTRSCRRPPSSSWSGTQRVSANITLQTQADIEAVFQMTPYYYRTRPADKRAPGKPGHASNRYRLHHRRVPPQLTTCQKGQVYFGRFYLGKRKGPTALLCDHGPFSYDSRGYGRRVPTGGPCSRP